MAESVVFVETPVFTRQIRSLIDDDDYAGLQSLLGSNPNYGNLLQGTGGLRKIRWTHRSQGRGKRGGIRVVYYFQVEEAQIYLLLAYPKSARDDLTRQERHTLRAIVENW